MSLLAELVRDSHGLEDEQPDELEAVRAAILEPTQPWWETEPTFEEWLLVHGDRNVTRILGDGRTNYTMDSEDASHPLNQSVLDLPELVWPEGARYLVTTKSEWEFECPAADRDPDAFARRVSGTTLVNFFHEMPGDEIYSCPGPERVFVWARDGTLASSNY